MQFINHQKYKYLISSLLNREPILQKTPTDCLTTIIVHFKIDILTHTLQSMELQKTMDKYDLKLVSFETTIYNTEIDHIRINAPLQQWHFRSIEAYWTNHKPIHIAFILQDHVLKFTLPNNTT